MSAPAQLQVVEIPVGKLHAADWNANRVTPAILAKIRNSIRQFGVVENSVVRPCRCDQVRGRHYEVLSGNHRLEIYTSEGLETMPCHVVELDDARARLLAQVLNRTRGKDDPDAYQALLEVVLTEVDVPDVAALLPESERNLYAVLGRQPGQLDPDECPPLPKRKPRSKRGQVYELGPHRLMCGDSTSPDDVATLLAGAEPELLLTDPPYGVQLDLVWRDRVLEGKGPKGGRSSGGDHYMRSPDHATTAISGDTRVDWSEAYELVPSLNVAYVWHAGQYAAPVQAGLERIGFVIAQQIVWDKEAFAISRAHYHWQHEAAFYAARVGAEVPWYGPQHTTAWYARKRGRHLPFLGDRSQSTVWRVPSPKMAAGGSTEAEYDHPTQKPVELYSRPILNHLEPGQCFYDCFGGSGSGLIAAELTGRVAYLMELDPLFVDVIRQRYADYVNDPSLAP